MKLEKKKVYYWSPSLVNIATNKAVINSALSLQKYSDDFTCEFSSLQSTLQGVSLQPGQYYIVVDGYAGQEGNYEINYDINY